MHLLELQGGQFLWDTDPALRVSLTGKRFILWGESPNKGPEVGLLQPYFLPYPSLLWSRPKSTFKWSDSLNLDSQDLHTAWSLIINHSRSITIYPLWKVGRSWTFWQTLHRSVWGWLTVRLTIEAGFTTDVCTQLDWVLAGILRYRFDLLAPIYIKLDLFFCSTGFLSHLNLGSCGCAPVSDFDPGSMFWF